MPNSWIYQPTYANVKSEEKNDTIPRGAWLQCSNCNETLTKHEIEDNAFICPKCDYHLQMPFTKRIELLTEPNSFKELFTSIPTKDPLKFTDAKGGQYLEKIKEIQKKTSAKESVIVGSAKVGKKSIYIGVMIFNFIGGSMGIACGEKIFQIMKLAAKKKRPLVLVCSSGGARMQEGLLSLMQMAKTSSGVEKLNKAKTPFIVILTNPTYGGVSASFASLGDIIISEPKASFGFAGKRVIESTVKQVLPNDFQTAEFLIEKGFIDIISHRKKLKNIVSEIIDIIDN